MPASRSRVGCSVSSSQAKSSSSSSSLAVVSDVLYKPKSSTTRTEDADEGETNDGDKDIWDLEKRGIPKCCICFEPPFRPVRLPCKCNSIVCFECFEQFIKNFSSCMICRELIVSRLRRQCQRRGWHVLIDERLGKWIQAQYSSSSGATSSAADPNGMESDKAMTEMAVRIIRPPDPGELKREAETLMEKFLKDRKAEEEASLTFLESLKRQGDADILEVERLQTDEELARKLMKEEEEELLKKSKSSSSTQPEPINHNTIVIIDEEEQDESTTSQTNELEIVALDSDTLPSSPLRMEDEPELFNPTDKDDDGLGTRKKRFIIKKSFTVASVFGPGAELAGKSDRESIKKRLRKASTLDSRIGSGSKRSSISMSSSLITDLTNQSMTSASSVALPVVSLTAKGSSTSTESALKTWTCRSCTYALTDIKWLRCDLCRSPKHV